MALTKKEQDSIIVSKAMQAASKRRIATKVIAIILFATLVLSGGAWGVMSIIDANSMMISISDKKEGLSLSVEPTFEYPTTKLAMKGPEKMDAYTYTWFNFEKDVLGKDGAHHGMGYICYSFYIKNISPTNPCLYNFDIKITKNTKNVASAIRFMVIESDENCKNEVYSAKVYAQEKEDGTAEFVSYNDCVQNQEALSLNLLNSGNSLLQTNTTFPFVGNVINEETGEDMGLYAVREKGKRLSHDSYVKYTILAWFEGTDLQCVNAVLGGKCVFSLNFELTEYLDVEYYGE